MTTARLASTVMLLRDGRGGLEVFMVQRHRNSGFLPHAWVFPGGRVDPGDRLAGHPRVRGGGHLAAAFGVDDAQGVAHGVAAVRETFEEAGLWLGSGALPDALRSVLNQGAVGLAAAMEAHGAAVDLGPLVPWSWWVTPQVEPKRYDTRFFAVAVPDGEASHDAVEVVDSRWVRPQAVIEARDQEGFPLAPPTWWTLRELAAFGSAAAALDGLHDAARPIQPVMRFDPSGMSLLLPGHPEHPDPAIPGVPDRVTFDGAWVGWVGDERLPDLPG